MQELPGQRDNAEAVFVEGSGVEGPLVLPGGGGGAPVDPPRPTSLVPAFGTEVSGLSVFQC